MKGKLSLGHAVNLGMGLRAVAALVGLAAVAVAIFLWQKQVRYEPAYRYKCAVAAFEVITDECLEQVQVPVNRQFDVVTNKGTTVGRWTTRPVAEGEMVHASHLTDKEPDRYRFHASGNPLPEETWGYFIAVESPALTQVQAGQLLTLGLVDPDTEQTVVLMDKVLILEHAQGGIYVGASWPQIAAMEGLKAKLAESATGKAEGEEATVPPWLVWTITQGVNPDMPSLAVFSTKLTAEALRTAEVQ